MTLAEQIAQHKPASIFDVLDRSIFSPDFDKPAEMAYIESGNCYEWYYAIGKHYKPSRILEIGVRFGYSLASLIKGSGGLVYVQGWDTEYYESESNQHARSITGPLMEGCSVQIIRVDSQREDQAHDYFDLIHIDGDHSYYGKVHDLMLAWMSGAKVIVVDDYDFLKSVREATDDFLSMIHPEKTRTAYLKSYRGTLVIERV